MQLTQPVIITPRLLAGVKIGDSFVSIEYSGLIASSNGRTVYSYHIDIPGFEYSACDLNSSCQGGNLQEGLESLLTFLSAAGEHYGYHKQVTEDDSFPPEIMEWTYQYSDELSMLAMELQESPDLIAE